MHGAFEYGEVDYVYISSYMDSSDRIEMPLYRIQMLCDVEDSSSEHTVFHSYKRRLNQSPTG